jgi:hypothetical protein
MIIKKLNDPYILNVKIELEAARTALNYRTRIQAEFKKEFRKAQASGGFNASAFFAMIAWNKLYIKKLLKEIDDYKKQLGSLYEDERKIIYLDKRGELSDK